MRSEDISKAQTAKVLDNRIADISKAVKEIYHRSKNLFDIEMNVKSWKASEQKLFDSNKAGSENTLRSAEKMQSSVVTNVTRFHQLPATVPQLHLMNLHQVTVKSLMILTIFE